MKKIVPLKNEVVEEVCEDYNPNIIFPIKIMGFAEGVRFRELALESVTCEPERREQLYQEVIELGLDAEKIRGFEGETLKLPPYMYDWLVHKITVHNTITPSNVKK